MKKILISVILFSFFQVSAQNVFFINGDFPNFPNSNYVLKGYNGFEEIIISKATSEKDGKFTLSYPKNYVGTAQLVMNGTLQTILLLNNENIKLYWEDLTKKDDLKTNSKEYNAFVDGMKIFQKSEAKLAGLNYLIPLYTINNEKKQWLLDELDTVTSTFPNYVKSLSENLYVRQYLLTKGLIEQMPNTVKIYTWRVKYHIDEFLAIDFNVLINSGLLKELIEGYTYLIQRLPLEDIYPLLNQAIDKLNIELQEEVNIKKQIAQFWFSLLEKQSLLKSAEYLQTKIQIE